MITLAELKTYIGLTTTTAAQDELLTMLERSAVAFLERSTRRYFGAPALYTEVRPGSGRDRIWLSREPIAAAGVLVTERWRPQDDGTELADPEDFIIRGRQLLRNGFWRRGAEYEATYFAGYGASGEYDGVDGPDYPPDIWRAVAEITKASWQARRTNEAMKSETISGYSYTRADDGGTLAVPAFVQGVVNNWKRELV